MHLSVDQTCFGISRDEATQYEGVRPLDAWSVGWIVRNQLFLDTSSHLNNRMCPSVRPLVANQLFLNSENDELS